MPFSVSLRNPDASGLSSAPTGDCGTLFNTCDCGFSGIWRKGSDVNESPDLWIVTRFGDDNSSVGVTDQKHGTIRKSNGSLRCGNIVRKRGERNLNRDYIQSLALKCGNHLCPTGPVHPRAMYKQHIRDRRLRLNLSNGSC